MFLKKIKMTDTENRNNVKRKTLKIRKMTEIKETKMRKRKSEKVRNKEDYLSTISGKVTNVLSV